LAKASGSGVDQVVPSSALTLKRGTPPGPVSSIAQVSELHVNELTPMPCAGEGSALSEFPWELKSHKRSLPGRDPPMRHCDPEQAVVVSKVEGPEGSVRLSHLPCGVENSATDVGPEPALDVPRATHTSLSVQATLVRGTSKLNAGVPLRCTGGATAVVPQLARITAPAARPAPMRNPVRTRLTARFMNSCRKSPNGDELVNRPNPGAQHRETVGELVVTNDQRRKQPNDVAIGATD
jgi:hypothetical protein